MSCGILTHKLLRPLFEEMNRRWSCKQCQKERSKFSEFDKKNEPPQYSNLLPGFSSEQVDIPLAVLVIGESHGGGREDDFCLQRDLDYEVSRIFRYYTMLPDKTFHQQQVRLLLNRLDGTGVKWAFTDLIKCFVWHKGSDGAENKRISLTHCRKHLEKQLAAFQPDTVIGLGNTVAQYFGLQQSSHGSVHSVTNVNLRFSFIHSLFPSRWTADQWIKSGGWEPVIRSLSS